MSNLKQCSGLGKTFFSSSRKQPVSPHGRPPVVERTTTGKLSSLELTIIGTQLRAAFALTNQEQLVVFPKFDFRG